MKNYEPDATPNEMEWIEKLAQRYRELYPEEDDDAKRRQKRSPQETVRRTLGEIIDNDRFHCA